MKDERIKSASEQKRLAVNNAEKVLIEFVSEHGGHVMCVPSRGKDKVYGYLWSDDDLNPIEEFVIDCVAVDPETNSLMVHRHEDWKDPMCFEVMKGDEENWYYIQQGEIISCITLDFILESIEEYL